MNILLTGGTGFVGTALARQLAQQAHCRLRLAVRRLPSPQISPGEVVPMGDYLGAPASLEPVVRGMDVVIHTAARVHMMRETSSDPLAAFRQVNVEGTLRLAHEAAKAGAKRFIFLSSVKVNGEASLPGHPFTEKNPPHPQDAYGQSKAEAENGLRAMALRTGMSVVIIRPPLVYGPGVRANFHALMAAVHRGLPLPLGAIDNRRSLVALGNLVDLIIRCTTHPAAENETFLVSDGQDLSTPELIERLAKAMQRPARLVKIPVWMLRAAGLVAGKRDAVERLCGNLQVDTAKARTLLDWTPPLSVDEALRQCTEGMLPS